MTYPKPYLDALEETLAHEGGWSDHPDDPGGKTFRGVTKAAWEAYVGQKVSAQALRSLTQAQITRFYFFQYWLPAKCNGLPRGVSAQIFDVSVNSGSRRAQYLLQDALRALGAGIDRDGRIGPATMDAVGTADTLRLINEIGHQRLSFYGWLIDRRSGFKSFQKGWRRRVVMNATFAAIEHHKDLRNRKEARS